MQASRSAPGNCTGSSSRRRAQRTSTSGWDRILCATASPRTCWRTASTSASSRCCSKQPHTAREHWTEGKIHYRFHPRCGEVVAIKRRLSRYGVDLVVIEQPDGSLAQLPAWMLREPAALLGLRADPRFPFEV